MLTSLMFISCGEDESMTKKLENGVNVFTFLETTQGFSAIADGSEYTVDLKTKVTGPNMQNVSGAVTATMVVDAASTAIEGVHYRIDNPNVTLSSDGDYLGIANITMLTEGIATPLAESPVLVLSFADASGSSAVVGGAKKLNLTLNYACPSSLEGSYDVFTTRDDGRGPYNWTETVKNIGVGEYLTEYVGTWIPPLNGDGYGFVFTDVCEVLTVPNQGLADIYSNAVYGASAGSVDAATGVLTISYVIEFGSGPVTYTSVYTPK